MNLQCSLACLSLLTGFVCLSQAQEQAPDPLVYNEAVVKANARLHEGGVEYGKVLATLYREEPVDTRELARQLDSLRKTLASVMADMEKSPLPDSDAARAFQTAHRKFLDGQKVLVDSDLPLVAKVLEDATLTLAAKKQKVEGILDSMGARENQTHQELLEAQHAYADAHGFTIKEEEQEYTVWVYRQVNGEWVKQEDRTLVTKSLEKAREYVASVKKYPDWTATTNAPE
jgi:hypothetical protein